MTAPQLAKAWTITPNVRNTYVSLNDMASWWFYQNHVAIKAKWTLKWTCDGTTGPANAGDTTDRLVDKTKCATRATVAAAAQSWAVYVNADGVQLKITFQGASDDILKVAYSRAGLYALAGTTTNEPTATDEVTMPTAATVVGSATSADRVMSIWVRDDGRAWSCAVFRAGAIQSIIGVEQVTSLATVRTTNPIFDVPYCLYKFTLTNRSTTANDGAPLTNWGASTTAQYGVRARVYTNAATTIGLSGGHLSFNVGTTSGSNAGQVFDPVSTKPAAQDSAAVILLQIYWSGNREANLDGLFASPIDWWVAYTSSVSVPALADAIPGFDPADTVTGSPRANWLVALGTAMVRPWRDAAASLVTS